jgi:hypothetical protein
MVGIVPPHWGGPDVVFRHRAGRGDAALGSVQGAVPSPVWCSRAWLSPGGAWTAPVHVDRPRLRRPSRTTPTASTRCCAMHGTSTLSRKLSCLWAAYRITSGWTSSCVRRKTCRRRCTWPARSSSAPRPCWHCGHQSPNVLGADRLQATHQALTLHYPSSCQHQHQHQHRRHLQFQHRHQHRLLCRHQLQRPPSVASHRLRC